MDGWLLAAALTSAALHASWNAVVKASPQPAHAMTAQMVGSAVLALPALYWVGLPALSAWPWMIGSTWRGSDPASTVCTARSALTVASTVRVLSLSTVSTQGTPAASNRS